MQMESQFGVNEYQDLGISVQNVYDELEKTNGGKLDTKYSKTTHSDDILEQHMGEIRTDENDELDCNQYENDQPNLQMESHSGINEYEDLGMSVQTNYDDLEKTNGGKMDANYS
ncbi:hypothetical protein MAR_032889 [Mya arenaria]|uniref:Uncharacterized protein n=1 Tax=Mya arenaria TaxID=6604 RepID=A0ABY7G8W8_MYAAR|nr:hypothetical protein MAR_032889 [Mya arenaria]